MGLVCVEQIPNSNLFSFFEEDTQKLTIAEDPKDFKGSDLVCYDAFKIFSTVDFTFSFLRDVKVLYELKGHRFDQLKLLAKEILGSCDGYEHLEDMRDAHLRSYKLSSISISKYSLFDLVPGNIIENLYKKRSSLILDLYHKLNDSWATGFYPSLYHKMKILHNISKNPLRIDMELLNSCNDQHLVSVKRNTVNGECFLKFDAVGAKTGRLSFRKGSLNLYTLHRSAREAILAPEDHNIVQIDFKSFQPRLAIFTTKDDSFKELFKNIEDIYSVFPGDREENKIAFLAWMFSKRRNKVFEEIAAPILETRKELYSSFRENGVVINRFGRPLYFTDEEENVIFQNYITSLEVDVILLLLDSVKEVLHNKKSKIAFPFHDSIAFYIHKDEMGLINDLKNHMEECSLRDFDSRFPVSIKIGSNLGNMEDYRS